MEGSSRKKYNTPQTSITAINDSKKWNINTKSKNKIVQDEDVAPLPLRSDELNKRYCTIFDDISSTECSSTLQVSSKINKNISTICLDDIIIEPDIDRNSQNSASLISPQAFKMSTVKEITVLLMETETIFLFEIGSISEEKGSIIGTEIVNDNKNYDFLTSGKGRNRKKVTSETQTEECILKTRCTIMSKIDMKNSYAFASTWDMFDSFAENNKTQILTTAESKKISNNRLQCFDIENDSMKEYELYKKIINNPRFTDAVIIMERVLANNVFKYQQECFKGLICEDVTEKKSDLLYLWSFDSESTQDMPVTSISWNWKNNDILAVGYGKYYYTENKNGIVGIWSIKNPIQPERLYHFTASVTCLLFSELNPNLLAVGFYDGNVKILDVTAYKTNVIAQSDTICPSYKPIWQVKWYSSDDGIIENVIAIGQDGKVNKYEMTKTKNLITTQIMTISRVEGLIKDFLKFPKYNNNDVPIVRNPPCLVLCSHPIMKDIYYVGTLDGCVYKCTTNYSNKHLDIFIAHDGPMFGMEYSIFSSKIFITCGADSTVKVWIESVTEPLIILKTMNPVECVAFHPTHSTIIAAISNTRVYLWDLKNTYSMLLAEMEFYSVPTKFTVLKFTGNGKNLIVSDVNGRVHVYNMSAIREVTDDERDLLHSSITKALKIKPELLKKFQHGLKLETARF